MHAMFAIHWTVVGENWSLPLVASLTIVLTIDVDPNSRRQSLPHMYPNDILKDYHFATSQRLDGFEPNLKFSFSVYTRGCSVTINRKRDSDYSALSVLARSLP